LRGSILVLEFNDEGGISEFIILDRDCGNFAAEIPPGRFHSMICLEPQTVAYEIKEGPYLPDTVKIFASWSPEEGSPEVELFLRKIKDDLGL